MAHHLFLFSTIVQITAFHRRRSLKTQSENKKKDGEKKGPVVRQLRVMELKS
jgi:hypothetical protein